MKLRLDALILSGKEREKKPRCIDLLAAKKSKSKGKIMVSKQPCLSVKGRTQSRRRS
jgi:hypothetical protein